MPVRHQEERVSQLRKFWYNKFVNYSWYTNSKSRRSPDAIHQILAFGDLYEIQFLKKTVGIKKLKSLFLKYPKKIYTAPLLNFVKNILLHIHTSVDEQKYLKNTPRRVG